MDIQFCFEAHDGKTIPYYKFTYKYPFTKVLKTRNKRYKREYVLEEGMYLPEYIAKETTRQFDFNSNYVVFDKVMFVIVHGFAECKAIRDLDNYTYKPFIDTIRKLKVIDDDTWEESGITNIGVETSEELIDLYVVPYKYYIEFLKIELDHLFYKKTKIQSVRDKLERERIALEFFE